MTTIRFLSSAGDERSIECPPGETLMQAAVNHSLPEILGECGGNCACATCHVYIDPAWVSRLPPPDSAEEVMLEGVLERRPNSRLGCQICVTADMDGMRVSLPTDQV